MYDTLVQWNRWAIHQHLVVAQIMKIGLYAVFKALNTKLHHLEVWKSKQWNSLVILVGNRWFFKTQVGLESSFHLQGGGLSNIINSTIREIGLLPHCLLEPSWIPVTQGGWCDFTIILRYHRTLVCIFCSTSWVEFFSLFVHSWCVLSYEFELAKVWK